MPLSQNQAVVSNDLGATVTILQQALAQTQKVRDECHRLGATSIAADVGAAADAVAATLAVLTKDLAVVNDLNAVT